MQKNIIKFRLQIFFAIQKFNQKWRKTMKNKYEGTQTEENLKAAFSGESEARNKYTYFASVAKK